MEKTEILDDLISQGEKLTQTISYVPPRSGSFRTFKVFNTTSKEEYQNWESASQRFIKTYFPSDLEDFKVVTEKLSPENHQKMMGILRAIKLMPEEPKNNKSAGSGNTSITINNTQQVVLNVFVEAIKDEITGKDYKILKDIIKDYEKEPEKTTSKIKEKLKSLGGDVLSSVISNILTNPNIYTGLF